MIKSIFLKFKIGLENFFKEDNLPQKKYFDDPIARSTEWHCLQSGRHSAGNNIFFREKVNNSLVTYQPVVSTWLPAIIGTFLYSLFLWGMMYLIFAVSWVFIFLTFFGFLFFALIVYEFLTTRTSYFDRNKKQFWYTIRINKKKQYCLTDFSDIHAIQILKYHSQESFGSIIESFDMNFVLKSGERIWVVSYNSYDEIIEESSFLSCFMGGKIVWDISEFDNTIYTRFPSS